MITKKDKNQIVDPLKNLVELVGVLVDFILTHALFLIVILGVGFLLIILFLLNFFNLLGF